MGSSALQARNKLILYAEQIFYYCVPVAQWQSIALAAQKVVGSIPREHT